MDQTSQIPVEGILRDELAHGDAVLGTITPILGHLVIGSQNSLFSDQIIANIRGMATSLAVQMLTEEAEVRQAQVRDMVATRKDRLANDLLANPAILSHCHALTIERILSDRLHERSAIDPVLSSMLQVLVSSEDSDISSVAMGVLTAQARFMQQQRRMELPVTELPGELFHAAVLVWRTSAGEGSEDISARAEMNLRARYDEGATRLGLMANLATGMGAGARAALSVSHAGVAIFLTALAHLSGQKRDIVILSTNERQLGRFALSLRASGLKPHEVEEQFLLIHPEIALPEGFEQLRVDRAQEMLASSQTVSNGSQQ